MVEVAAFSAIFFFLSHNPESYLLVNQPVKNVLMFSFLQNYLLAFIP